VFRDLFNLLAPTPKHAVDKKVVRALERYTTTALHFVLSIVVNEELDEDGNLTDKQKKELSKLDTDTRHVLSETPELLGLPQGFDMFAGWAEARQAAAAAPARAERHKASALTKESLREALDFA